MPGVPGSQAGRQAGRHRMLASVRSREQRGGETLSKLELRI